MRRRAQPWLGTLVDISIADPLDEPVAHAAFDNAFAAIAQVHRLMSFHEPASDVSRVNRASAGQFVDVHPFTHAVIAHALELSEESDGIFDIACASRLAEWGYLPSSGEVPVAIASREMLLAESGNRIGKLHDGWIDLGGIAKGYAVDAAIDALQRAGIESACVNAGGDLRVLGAAPYMVAVRDPRNPRLIAMEMPVSDEAMATSGAYFTRKQDGEELRSALIDGRSGAALTRDFSVSVQAANCMFADALTKVVAATGNVQHPVLARYGAAALII